MPLPSVPVGRPAASVATPAGRAPPAAAEPAETRASEELINRLHKDDGGDV